MMNTVAFVWNRTMLGLGVLVTVYHAYHAHWVKVAIGLVLIGVYFVLHDYFDAP